jgi:hypothetical protein
MAIYSRGGPAITSRSRIVSQAHGDHVSRRYSEGDYGMSATTAELTGLGGRQWGLRLDSGNSATYALFNSDSIHFLSRVNPDGGGANLHAGRSPAVSTQRWQSDPKQSTVPWRTAFRAPDSQHLGSIFSQIYMVTYSMLCSKVGELQISYKFVIVAMGRFLMDHSWIYAQSLSGCTVCLKIQTQ